MNETHYSATEMLVAHRKPFIVGSPRKSTKRVPVQIGVRLRPKTLPSFTDAEPMTVGLDGGDSV